MSRDDIGDRFKDYEASFDYTLPRRVPMIIRVDGRAFHGINLEKPFDEQFWEYMAATAVALCKEIQGAVMAYFQSDEISIVVRDDFDDRTEAWMKKRLSKILSLSAATASVSFNAAVRGALIQRNIGDRQFDSRVLLVPSVSEVVNYMIWRQQDAMRNSISMVAQSIFTQGQLNGVPTIDLLEMIRDAGHPWEDYALKFQRGCVVHKIATISPFVDPRNGSVVTPTRRHWNVDIGTPIFTEHRDYLKSIYENHP